MFVILLGVSDCILENKIVLLILFNRIKFWLMVYIMAYWDSWLGRIKL